MTPAADRPPAADAFVSALLQPDEHLLRAAAATPAMRLGGLPAVCFAVPAFAVGAWPLGKALGHHGPLDGIGLLFGGFGLFWIVVAMFLLREPLRRHRLWPHVVHILTDRRFIEADRRSGVLHAVELSSIWTMKIFAPFGRLGVSRRGVTGGTGESATKRDFDGVADVAEVAQAIADLTGVPVGQGRAAVAASIARLPPGKQLR